jgi:tRNA(fMet)-specific endonuclease VapC
MDIIDIDQLISEEARRIYMDLKKINKLVPFPDLFIAATASIKNIPLATLNKKHFEFIEGIEIF